LTQFSFNAKVNIPSIGCRKNSNLTISKVAVVTLWIQIVGTFLFIIFKLSK